MVVDLATLTRSALSRVVEMPPPVDLPPGRRVELAGRGSTWLVDVPGPEGAPTLLLLHALACTANLCWFPSIPALSEHFRVVMFDQRRHGRGIDCEHFTLEDCADDAAAVIETLGLEHVIPVGYSMGGLVAQLVWRRHRRLIEGMVLAGTARNFCGHTRERAFFALLGATMATGMRGYCLDRVQRVTSALAAEPMGLAAHSDLSPWAMAELRSTSAWSMPEILHEISRFDSSPWIQRVDVPTSVVVMTADHAIPTRRQRKLVAAIPGALAFEAPAPHSGIVLHADTVVPVLVDACRSVAKRAARLR